MQLFPRLSARLAVLPVALLALACTESVESTDVKTTGIYPEIEVVATGNGDSKVTVKLKVGGDDSNTFLDLTGDDTLEATADGETKTLDQSGNSYSASFGVDAEGTEFTIAFLRGEDEDSAPESTVIMPAPFELTLGATEASRSDDALEYTWDPPADGGDMEWQLDGECVRLGLDGSTPDDGANELAAGKIETSDSDKEESCTVELELTRAQGGDIDAAFTEGGSIVAKHVRSDSFTSTP
jgi:hypothetical protein